MISKKSMLALVLSAGTVASPSFAQAPEAPARPADLVVVSARLIPDRFAPKFQVTMRNQGPGHASASRLMVKYHGANLLGMLRDDAGIASMVTGVPALSAGETRTLEFPTGIAIQLRLSAATPGQVVYFTALADCHHQVAETTAAGAAELNNVLRFNSLP
jgi:hypothetical protein